jgi:hypothetical protein
MCNEDKQPVGGLGDNVGDKIGQRLAAELGRQLKPLVDAGIETVKQFRRNGVKGGITKADGEPVGGWWLQIPTKPANPMGPHPGDHPPDSTPTTQRVLPQGGAVERGP